MLLSRATFLAIVDIKALWNLSEYSMATFKVNQRHAGVIGDHLQRVPILLVAQEVVLWLGIGESSGKRIVEDSHLVSTFGKIFQRAGFVPCPPMDNRQAYSLLQ